MISVILCTYNRSAMLRQVLATLEVQSANGCIDWELLVVDNNSSDDTKVVVAELAARKPAFAVRYVFEDRQGKSHALNAGIEAAGGEIIAFTDDDVHIDREWIRQIDEAFRTLPCSGIGGRVRPVWQQPRPSWLITSGPNRLRLAIIEFDYGDSPYRLDGLSLVGCNMAFKREMFRKYGPFRTDLGPTPDTLLRGEDTELSYRLLSHGEPLYYAPAVVVDHPVEQKRVTKAYYLSWYFDFGRTRARMGDLSRVRRLAGLPRFLIRPLLASAVKWLLTPMPSARFRRKLEAAEMLGRVLEARRLLAEPVAEQAHARPSGS